MPWKYSTVGDLPGGPVAETSPSKAGCVGSIPNLGAKLPYVSWETKK